MFDRTDRRFSDSSPLLLPMLLLLAALLVAAFYGMFLQSTGPLCHQGGLFSCVFTICVALIVSTLLGIFLAASPHALPAQPSTRNEAEVDRPRSNLPWPG